MISMESSKLLEFYNKLNNKDPLLKRKTFMIISTWRKP
jgi:hypothetical protein